MSIFHLKLSEATSEICLWGYGNGNCVDAYLGAWAVLAYDLILKRERRLDMIIAAVF